MHKSSQFRPFYFYLREWLGISPEQQKAPPERLALLMGTDYILTRFALLAALVKAGRPKLIQLVCSNLVSGMILADAPIAFIFSPIRNDLPYIEPSIIFVFKISRAVVTISISIYRYETIY